MVSQHPPVLLVEHDAVHAARSCAALTGGGLVNPVHVSPTALDAVAWLEAVGPYADRPRPALVVTEALHPGAEPLEALRVAAGVPELAGVPLVVLTVTDDEALMTEAYDLGCAAYLLKPVGHDALVDVLRGLRMPWAVTGAVTGVVPEQASGVVPRQRLAPDPTAAVR